MKTGRPEATVVLSALVLGLSCAAAQAAPDSKTFRDWTVGCDNLKACTALSLPAEDSERYAYLKLTRAAGPETVLNAGVSIRAGQLKAPLNAVITVDGAAFPAAGTRWPVRTIDEDTAQIELSPGDAEALVAAARKASKVTIVLGRQKLDMSLAGAVAALLWMDEQQGRLNTTTALIRKGTGTAVPAAPALPVVAAKASTAPALPAAAAKALTAGLRAHLKRIDPDGCDDAPEGFADADHVWPLDGTQRLVSLLCSAGAYNLSSGFWFVQGNDVAKARKAEFPQIDGGRDHMLVNPDYTAAEGTISYFAKGRGFGDCGNSGTYAWTGTGFVLTAFSTMGECRGILPDDWLTLVRSDVKVPK